MNTRTVDLKQYVPPFLLDFRELKEIYDTENPEFQGLADNNIRLLDEMFITTASEVGISKFEALLGIQPLSTATLEQRREDVLTRWWDMSVYTMRTLKQRLIALQGNDNVQVWIDEEYDYTLNIVTRLEKMGQVDNLAYIIDTMIPCNLVVISRNYVEVDGNVDNFVAVGLVGTGYIFLTNDFNETVNGDLELCCASGVVGTGYIFLTNDFNESVDIGGNAFVGMANTYTEIITSN